MCADQMLVNVVSQIPAEIWEREVPEGLTHDYVHTHEPAHADVHVIYGLRSRLTVPNTPSRTIFIASEPPEIREYNLHTLKRYRLVLAPSFSYLSGLSNYRMMSPVAPWWVGTHAGGKNHYGERAIDISLTRQQLSEPITPTRDRLTVIMSSKNRTPLQQQRLRFLDYLARKMDDVEVWGEGRQIAPDKAQILAESRYHLAIENSEHSGYWTEKLADPILMSNYVFYHGDPEVDRWFDTDSVKRIDCFDPEASYRVISESMAAGAWASAAEAREVNKRAILERHSFHRVLDNVIGQQRFDPSSAQMSVIRAQHRTPVWKRFADPLYQAAKSVLGRQ